MAQNDIINYSLVTPECVLRDSNVDDLCLLINNSTVCKSLRKNIVLILFLPNNYWGTHHHDSHLNIHMYVSEGYANPWLFWLFNRPTKLTISYFLFILAISSSWVEFQRGIQTYQLCSELHVLLSPVTGGRKVLRRLLQTFYVMLFQMGYISNLDPKHLHFNNRWLYQYISQKCFMNNTLAECEYDKTRRVTDLFPPIYSDLDAMCVTNWRMTRCFVEIHSG